MADSTESRPQDDVGISFFKCNVFTITVQNIAWM